MLGIYPLGTLGLAENREISDDCNLPFGKLPLPIKMEN
jgi:hypothetical protein